MTGVIVNYYIFCKRMCWLFYNKLNMEDNSELVAIGKELHNKKAEKDKNSEISIEHIKLDSIGPEYVVEYKKSDADIAAAEMQLLYYLYTLKQKGIDRKGLIKIFEKKGSKYNNHEVILDDKSEAKLLNAISEIEILVQNEIPEVKLTNKCKKCAYYEYCCL